LIFQKGVFDYKSISSAVREKSKIDTKEFQDNDWYKTIWEMTNVLPGSPLEKGVAAFPDELAYRLIKLFSYVGETVLDPFLGSGTTSKIACKYGRNSVGYEIIRDLESIIAKKVCVDGGEDTIEFVERKDGKYKFVYVDYIKKNNEVSN